MIQGTAPPISTRGLMEEWSDWVDQKAGDLIDRLSDHVEDQNALLGDHRPSALAPPFMEGSFTSHRSPPERSHRSLFTRFAHRLTPPTGRPSAAVALPWRKSSGHHPLARVYCCRERISLPLASGVGGGKRHLGRSSCRTIVLV